MIDNSALGLNEVGSECDHNEDGENHSRRSIGEEDSAVDCGSSTGDELVGISVPSTSKKSVADS